MDHVRYYVGQFVSLTEEGSKRMCQFVDCHSLQMRFLAVLVRGMSDETEQQEGIQTTQRLNTITADMIHLQTTLRQVTMH